MKTNSTNFSSTQESFLTSCWAKGMTVSSTFNLARTKNYNLTYQQITSYFDSKSSNFNTAFELIFRS